MIARIPAALLPLLSPLSVRVGQPGSGVMIPIRTGKHVFHLDAGARAFTIDPDRLYVDTLHPTARDMLCRAIADHLGVPGDGPAAIGRDLLDRCQIQRFSISTAIHSAPLPIPADTPGAEVIGRAMAVLWGAE